MARFRAFSAPTAACRANWTSRTTSPSIPLARSTSARSKTGACRSGRSRSTPELVVHAYSPAALSVVKNLIEALRSGKLAEVRAAIKADPAAARHARVIGEAGRLAFQKAMELLHRK